MLRSRVREILVHLGGIGPARCFIGYQPRHHVPSSQAAECGVTLPDIGTATAFTNKVRNALARRQDGLAWERESITGTVLWHVAEDANGLPDTRQKVSAP
jgi:hypothetical protein